MKNDQEITDFYRAYPQWQNMALFSRIGTTAQYFIGKPYQFEPWGEGKSGIYSTLPLYRLDQFDCVTYVDTVLALARARDIPQFKQNIIHVRYLNHREDYTQRTDWFTDLEWNPHLRQLGYVRDVTEQIVGKDKRPVALFAHTVINKLEWYSQKTLVNLDLPGLSEADMRHRLSQLKDEGKNFSPQTSVLPYLPLSCLFDREGRPVMSIWNQLPDSAVIEIIRPDWRPVDPKDKNKDYGTSLNVAHIGLGLRIGGDVIFYHASSVKRKVEAISLVNYLQAFLDDKCPAPVRGIHVEALCLA